MLFIFHAKLKRGSQKYFRIKQKLILKTYFTSGKIAVRMGKSTCQISATVFTLANSYGSYSVVFSKIL